MTRKDFFKFTKIKVIITIVILIIVLFLLFNKFYYQFCATDLLCMAGDIECQKTQFLERWICPLIPSLISLPFILGIAYFIICYIIYLRIKIFP